MRKVCTHVGWLVCVALGAWWGCSSGEDANVPPGYGGASGVGGAGGSGGGTATGSTSGTHSGSGGGASGLGVGEPCTKTEANGGCRPGLVCDPKKKTCEPGHDSSSGTACEISDECKAGLFCDHDKSPVCAPAGKGAANSSCKSDADCQAGLRCNLAGFGAQCQPEGMKDIGGSCSGNADCFGGLACEAGKCAPASGPGGGFGLPPWPGVTAKECNDTASHVTAYFSIPRSGKSQDFYRLPFPNDVLVSNGAVDLTGFPTPGSAFLGYDIVQRYVDAIQSTSTGFGVYESVFFRFSGEIDLNTLNAGVSLVDLTTGDDLALDYSYSIGGGHYICPNWVALRPPQGQTYKPTHTYAAYFTNSLQAKGGAPVEVSPDFTAMLGATAPGDATLAAQWPKYQGFRDYLASLSPPTDPSTVLVGTVFTVSDPTVPLTKIDSVVEAGAAPTAKSWTLCNGTNMSPCSDTTGDRACPTTPDPDFDELQALVTLPIFQSGTAPYLTPSDGGDLVLDGSGNPIVQTTEDVCMAMTVPHGTMPNGGWPTVVFAHGTGGDFRTHITEGVAKDFANGVSDGHGNTVKAVVIGIDQVQTGPRRNGNTQSPNDLFFNFANPKAARGNVQQGAADQLSLQKFVPSLNLTAATSPTGTQIKLKGPGVFFGHSQGATEGGLMLPFSKYAGAVTAGQGACLMDSLVTKTNPVDIAQTVPFVLEDIDGQTGRLPGAHDPKSKDDTDQNHPVLNLIQMYMDVADPISFAQSTVAVPVGAETPHPIFQPYGQRDTYSPPLVEATYSLAAQFGLVAPDTSVTTPDPIGSLTTIPTPAGNNLKVGVALTPESGLVREYAPSSGDDGHFVVFNVTNARNDAEQFLAGLLSGGEPVVGQ